MNLADGTIVEHWTDYPITLTMSTLEECYRDYLAEHGATDGRTADQIHLWLAKEFGRLATRRLVQAKMNSH